MNFGDKLKQLRVKMNLTQEELANRCDLSKGFISQVERDLTSPSIATLVDILECLGTTLNAFFNEPQNDTVVFRKDDIFVQENIDLGHCISWLIPNAQKNKMEPILIKLKPYGKSETHSPHDGEVFGYVTGGSATLHLGSESYRLKKNESFYYKANSPYYLENNSRSEASVIWVSTPPNF